MKEYDFDISIKFGVFLFCFFSSCTSLLLCIKSSCKAQCERAFYFSFSFIFRLIWKFYMCFCRGANIGLFFLYMCSGLYVLDDRMAG